MVRICYIVNKMRKDLLVTGEYYHVFSRSIADFRIFNQDDEFLRIKQLLKYYQTKNDLRFSDFIELKKVQTEGFNSFFEIISRDKENLVQIIAYCLMPTHVHLILKQLKENGISIYMANVFNSYSRYFNTKHKRKGPLWESEFRNIRVKNNEQLLHLTRYLHLNPVTAKLIDHPEDWFFSSYREYLSKESKVDCLCQFDDILDIEPFLYRRFVNDRIACQRKLAKIKSLILD